MSNASLHDSLPTAWTVILAAQQAGPEATAHRHCLEHLFVTYREPVRAMIRAWGLQDEDKIEERLQEYFTRFLEEDWLSRLDPDRGRFGAFLKVSVRHFLCNEHQKSRRHALPLTGDDGEDGLVEHLADPAPPPDVLFDRVWAQTVLTQTLAAFEREFAHRKLPHYREVFARHVLHDGDHPPTYAETAKALDLTARQVDNAPSPWTWLTAKDELLPLSDKSFCLASWQQRAQTMTAEPSQASSRFTACLQVRSLVEVYREG